jgi:hypothetical protein
MNLLDSILNEDLWFPSATGVALLVVTGLILRCRPRGLSTTTMLACGLNLFYGVLIGFMGFGHLLAVTIMTIMGTLPVSTNPWFVFPLGFALVIPAWWLVGSVKGLSKNRRSVWHRAIALNACLGALLLPLAGPLATPAAASVILLVWERPG